MARVKLVKAGKDKAESGDPARPNILRSDAAAANQSLARGLAILQAFDLAKPEWGIRELGRELDLDRSVVLRLVQTLAAAGFLERNKITSRYRIGPRAFEVGQRFTRSTPLYDVALSQMRNLHDAHNLDVYLAVRLEAVVLYLGAIEADDVALRAVAGTRGHLHATSLGKILLAFEDDDVVQELLKDLPLMRLTPATKTSKSALLKDIASARKRGYALADGENFAHIFSVAAPIYDGSGKMAAAISASRPRASAAKAEQAAMIEAVTSCASQISRLLGSLKDPGPVPALPIWLPGKPKTRTKGA